MAKYIGKAIASVAVCAATAIAIKETGSAYCLWALLLVLGIW